MNNSSEKEMTKLINQFADIGFKRIFGLEFSKSNLSSWKYYRKNNCDIKYKKLNPQNSR